MNVRVDVAGDQDVARRIENLRARAHHLVAHADVRDPLTPRRDVGRVQLAGIDVEQSAAAHVQIGGSGATSHVGQAPTLSDGHDR
jgi:hypothetical protein